MPCTTWGGPATALQLQLQPAPAPPRVVASPRHPPPEPLQCTTSTKRDRNQGKLMPWYQLNRPPWSAPHPQTPRVTKAGDVHSALRVICFKDAHSCPALPCRSDQCVRCSEKRALWHLLKRSMVLRRMLRLCAALRSLPASASCLGFAQRRRCHWMSPLGQSSPNHALPPGPGLFP